MLTEAALVSAAVLLSLVLGTLASLHAAIRLGRREVYLSFREGE